MNQLISNPERVQLISASIPTFSANPGSTVAGVCNTALWHGDVSREICSKRALMQAPRAATSVCRSWVSCFIRAAASSARLSSLSCIARNSRTSSARCTCTDRPAPRDSISSVSLRRRFAVPTADAVVAALPLRCAFTMEDLLMTLSGCVSAHRPACETRTRNRRLRWECDNSLILTDNITSLMELQTDFPSKTWCPTAGGTGTPSSYRSSAFTDLS